MRRARDIITNMRRRNHWDTDQPEGCLLIVIALVAFWCFISLIVYLSKG